MNTSTAEPTIQNLFDLSGRTALVTGGCGHLGQAMCRALAEAGANVIVSSRDPHRASEFAQSLVTPGKARHCGIALDHLQPDSLSESFRQAQTHGGPISILINNAHEGVAADWQSITPEQFNRQLENATGYFTLAKLFRDHIVEQAATGSLVMLGSMYGLVGSYPDAYDGLSIASPVAYHALKGGIVQMTRHLAVYWAKDRVRVNCLSPGPFPAPGVSHELVARLSSKSPMGRIGTPSELKGAILFLASDASSYMTGQNIVIDGGWTAW